MRDREMIAAHIERLRAMRAGGKTIPTFAVDQVASALGVTRSTVWRWIKDGVPDEPGRQHKLTKEEIALYYDLRGNVAAVARALEGRPDAPSRQTLQRAFSTQLSSAERAYAKGGVSAARANSLYLRYEVDHRNQRWESDHKQLPIMIIPRRGMKAVKPWATIFLDAFTRAIMGAALVPRRPTRAEVLAALRSAVLVDAERGPFGGIPDVLVWDNGLEFTSQDVNNLALELGCVVAPTDAYAPTQKGKIERLNRTLEQELVSTLPFYSDGPRAANNKHFGPKCVDPLLFGDFAEIFFDWVWKYNNERAHSALDERTPQEAWTDDATPIREVDPSELRWMLPSANRKILKDGIHHDGRTYWASDLIGLVGERVEVRYMPFDYRQVEVFRNGKWLTTAVRSAAVSAEERERFYKLRQQETKRAAQRMRSASRRSAARLIALTKAGEPVDGDPVAASFEADKSRRTKRASSLGNLKVLGIEGTYEVEELGIPLSDGSPTNEEAA